MKTIDHVMETHQRLRERGLSATQECVVALHVAAMAAVADGANAVDFAVVARETFVKCQDALKAELKKQGATDEAK